MAKYTIGIPTFNRAGWLKNAIECALNQSYQDVEILVSDNASTDKTAKIVQRFGSRVRYIRNETNVGATANFRQLVELASGDYFSWLQDDDCIFNQFAERAVACLDRFPRATFYAAYATVSGSMGILANGWLYGPPVKLDWSANKPREFFGDLIAPLSLCTSLAIPPTVAFRLPALRKTLPRWDSTIPLFLERMILCDVAATSAAIFDPFIGGIFRSHAKQNYRQITETNPDAPHQQWLAMARQLDQLPIQRNSNWRQRLSHVLDELDQRRQQWAKESQSWPQDIGLCQEMRQALIVKPESGTFDSIFNAGKWITKDLFSKSGA